MDAIAKANPVLDKINDNQLKFMENSNEDINDANERLDETDKEVSSAAEQISLRALGLLIPSFCSSQSI